MNLEYLEEVTAGDIDFKKELIDIFLKQVPEFISNMQKFFDVNDLENLAKEAHTAKSSALIFGLEETGAALKNIQRLAEAKKAEQINGLLSTVSLDLKNATVSLSELAKKM